MLRWPKPLPGSVVLTIVAIAGNALMFAIAFAVALKPFIGARVETPKHPHEAPPLLWLGPVVLAILGLATAVVSGFWHAYISSPMARAVGGKAMEISVSLVPHFGVPLALSLLTSLIGVFVYWKLDRRSLPDVGSIAQTRAWTGSRLRWPHLRTCAPVACCLRFPAARPAGDLR